VGQSTCLAQIIIFFSDQKYFPSCTFSDCKLQLCKVRQYWFIWFCSWA